MSVTVPSDRRFRRSRIHATRRRHLRTRPLWRALRLVTMLAVLAGVGYWAAQEGIGVPWLRVQHITVRGNQRVQTGEILGLLDGLKGDNLLATDLEKWRARLYASTWIVDATLRRRLPGTVDVEVRERQPAGIARVGTSLILIDASGQVIDEYGPRYADLDLPVIDGLVVDPRAVPPTLDRARSQLVFRLLADLRTRPDLCRRVSQIDVQDVHDAHVILDDDPAVIRLGDTQFVERLESYVGLQATLRESVPNMDYVDLRFGERVYVGPAFSTVPTVKDAPAPIVPAPGPRQQR
jgi:cell division septal protein FtsQ